MEKINYENLSGQHNYINITLANFRCKGERFFAPTGNREEKQGRHKCRPYDETIVFDMPKSSILD